MYPGLQNRMLILPEIQAKLTVPVRR
jgi:hypothetical protein